MHGDLQSCLCVGIVEFATKSLQGAMFFSSFSFSCCENAKVAVFS